MESSYTAKEESDMLHAYILKLEIFFETEDQLLKRKVKSIVGVELGVQNRTSLWGRESIIINLTSCYPFSAPQSPAGNNSRELWN